MSESFTSDGVHAAAASCLPLKDPSNLSSDQKEDTAQPICRLSQAGHLHFPMRCAFCGVICKESGTIIRGRPKRLGNNPIEAKAGRLQAPIPEAYPLT